MSEGFFDGGRKFALFRYWGLGDLIKSGMKGSGNREDRLELARWLAGTLPSLRPWLSGHNCKYVVAMPGHEPASDTLTANEWMCLLIASRVPELKFLPRALVRTEWVPSYWRDRQRPGLARHLASLRFSAERPRVARPPAVLLFDDQYTRGDTSAAAIQIIESATGATVLGLYLTRSNAPLATNPAVVRDGSQVVPLFATAVRTASGRVSYVPHPVPYLAPRRSSNVPASLRRERQAKMPQSPASGAQSSVAPDLIAGEVPLGEVRARGWSWTLLPSEWVGQASVPHRLDRMGRELNAAGVEEHRLFGGRYYWLFRGAVYSTEEDLEPPEVCALAPPDASGKSRPTSPSTQEAVGAKAMDTTRATEIIELLARGIDPWTGENLKDDHTLQHPDAVRALYAAMEALRGQHVPSKAGSAARPRSSSRRPNSGSRWSDEDHERLLRDFDAGVSRRDLASSFGRTEGAITSRLVKFGRLDATEIQGLVPNAIPKDAVPR